MKKLLFSLIIVFSSLTLHAEDENPLHHVSLYFGGPASIGSIEYEYHMIQKPRTSLAFSMGIGSNTENLSIPVGVLFTYGGRDQILLGIHSVPLINTSMYYYHSNVPTLDLSHFSLRAGYRKNFMIRDEKFFFQLFFSPLIETDFSSIITYLGMGFGACL